MEANIHACQKSCTGCPFTGPKVGSKGDPTSPVVFVAESPGYQEVRAGEPLVGTSGKTFHKYVPEPDTGAYYLNAIECCPPQGLKNEKRINAAAHACSDRLLEKVKAHPRRIIIAMGNAALRALTGDYSLKITQVRGRIIESPLAEVGILPIVHIAGIMRGTGSFRQWREDIELALQLGAGASPQVFKEATYEIVDRDISADDAFEALWWGARNGGGLTADIETSSLSAMDGRILQLGITPFGDGTHVIIFYLHHMLKYYGRIKELIESGEVNWCWHNGKFDIKFLREIKLWGRVDQDTMLMSYSLDESGGVHDLEQVMGDLLNAPDYKNMLKPWLPNKKTSYEVVPPEILSKYLAIDVGGTEQIRQVLSKKVNGDRLNTTLYNKTLIPANDLLATTERNGFYVDTDRLAKNDEEYKEELEEIREEIAEICGRKVNPNSPPQMKDALFNQFKFPNRKKGSTAEAVLEDLYEKTQHPFLDAALRYRKAAKAHGTYVKGIYKSLYPDGRVHTTYKIHGTRTGRLSSANPNIQNIPRDPRLRGQFIAEPGYDLLEVDLSQAELRTLAALSKDPELVRIYREGRDLHTELAIYLFPGWEERAAQPKGSKEFQQAYEERVRCKNVNFGIIYGITAAGLMGQINDTFQAAQYLINGWFDKFPVAGEFITKCRNAPVRGQVISTMFGRRKRAGIVSRDNLHFLQNEAANFPEQSIASDITLHAAMKIFKALKYDLGVNIVNMVHDSIIMETPPVAKLEAARMAIDALENTPVEWGIEIVPFKADAEHGTRWGSLVDYEEAA